MKQKKITAESMERFRIFLQKEERSAATVEKYLRDVRHFYAFVGGSGGNGGNGGNGGLGGNFAVGAGDTSTFGAEIDKQTVLDYKSALGKEYAVASANSMIAALNAFLKFCGWHDLCVKQFRVQREAFCLEEKELTRAEYVRLIDTARQRGNERLNLIIQTICGTGIRVSELAFITVEAVERGEATVNCKGKNRRIFIVPDLKRKLLRYAKEQKIHAGAVFVTRSGRPIGRCAIWKEMKRLCREAKVPPSKVFPHNLRHLFARTFYGIEKDIAKLADILGHASINTTRIYIVTTGAEHRKKMANMRLII